MEEQGLTHLTFLIATEKLLWNIELQKQMILTSRASFWTDFDRYGLIPENILFSLLHKGSANLVFPVLLWRLHWTSTTFYLFSVVNRLQKFMVYWVHRRTFSVETSPAFGISLNQILWLRNQPPLHLTTADLTVIRYTSKIVQHHATNNTIRTIWSCGILLTSTITSLSSTIFKEVLMHGGLQKKAPVHINTSYWEGYNKSANYLDNRVICCIGCIAGVPQSLFHTAHFFQAIQLCFHECPPLEILEIKWPTYQHLFRFWCLKRCCKDFTTIRCSDKVPQNDA